MAYKGSKRKLFYMIAVVSIVASSLYLFQNRDQSASGWHVNFDSQAVVPLLDRNTVSDKLCDQVFSGIFDNLMSSYRTCLLEYLDQKSRWAELHLAVSACLGGVLEKLLDMRYLENYDDVKVIILPSKDEQSIDCIQVTLGVGNDTESEKALKALIPSCRFYGVDPISSSGTIFRELGPYYEIAVGAEKGFLEADVLEDGEYRRKKVDTITLLEFLESYAKVDHVDYLFMDNEGPEYGIFEQFQPGGILDSFIICQISVEMHGPMPEYITEEKLDELVTKTLTDTAYLPFWSTEPQNHIRTFYVNVKDKYCVDTYFRKRFCGNSRTV